MKPHSAALLKLYCGAVWGSRFDHRHLCVMFLSISSLVVEEKDS